MHSLQNQTHDFGIAGTIFNHELLYLEQAKYIFSTNTIMELYLLQCLLLLNIVLFIVLFKYLYNIAVCSIETLRGGFNI